MWVGGILTRPSWQGECGTVPRSLKLPGLAFRAVGMAVVNGYNLRTVTAKPSHGAARGAGVLRWGA